MCLTCDRSKSFGFAVAASARRAGRTPASPAAPASVDALATKPRRDIPGLKEKVRLLAIAAVRPLLDLAGVRVGEVHRAGGRRIGRDRIRGALPGPQGLDGAVRGDRADRVVEGV